jgi:acetyl-CoA C-acetyltransferase
VREAVIATPLRTPVGRFGGALRDVPVQELAATVIRALVARTGIDPERVEDVILGHAYPSGDAPALGRVAALDAGLPVSVPGVQVDRRCGSGLAALLQAAMTVGAGGADLILAGGAESMSRVGFTADGLRFGRVGGTIELRDGLDVARVTAGGRFHPVPGGMLETAENLRRDLGIAREDQDQLALRSHLRAVAAQRESRFAAELVPVEVPGKNGVTLVDLDEHPRADTTLERLAGLRAVRAAVDPAATVTAGNASGQNDGAALAVVTTREAAERDGLGQCVRVVSWGLAGVEPARMGLGPVPATALALARAGLRLEDMDLIELNEAFAAQVLAVTRTWGLGEADEERLNVNGSGIALGHPVGATGARIVATLAHELHRREARYGLVTMCIGGGQGLAAVLERIA